MYNKLKAHGKNHSLYLLLLVIIIVIFIITLLCILYMNTPEPFTDNIQSTLNKYEKINYFDSYVPKNLRFWDLTNSYKNSLKGTPILNISAIEYNRHPAIQEVPTNWYNTQGLCCVFKNNVKSKNVQAKRRKG